MISTAFFDVLAALALLGLALLGAYAPVVLSSMGKNSGAPAGRSLAYILGNMLSAGVMISAGFVHLLGAAIAELNPAAVFPLAPFLCALGFILTLLADHTAETLSRRSGWDVPSCHSHVHPAPPRQQPESSGAGKKSEEAREPGENLGEEESTSLSPKTSGGARFDIESPPLMNGNGVGHRSMGRDGWGDSPRGRGGDPGPSGRDREPLVGRGAIDSSEESPLQTSVSLDSIGGRSLTTLVASISEAKQVSFMTAVLMAGALCFHSILEGMAMGAQGSIVDTLHIFIAIMAHKGLAAYALGSSIVDSGASRLRFWVVIGIFAVATPVGIGLGRIVASVSNSAPAAALSALASGTFLYVAFMEVIPKEMQTPEHGFSKLGMLCLGFGAMSLLAVWA